MADSKEEKSWFSQAWDWTRNSLLGRTIGIDDATKAGKESKGLWGETKDLLGIGSSKETTAQKETVAQPETKGLWGWMKNSLLGRTFGLADEGNNEPGLWGMFKNSMIGRTFGLEDEGNNKPGLWGWMKNSMLGRALGLADKKEATANGAAQQTQAPQTAAVSNQQANVQQVQKASNGAIIDDVIVEHSTVNAPKAAAKAAAPKAAAPKTPAKEAAPNTATKEAAPNAAAKEAASNIRLEDIGSEFGGSLTEIEVTAPRLLDPSVSEVTLGYNPKTSGTTLIDANESSDLCSLLNTITAVRNGTTVDGFGLNPLDTKTVGDNAGLGAVPNIAGIYLGDKAR